MVQEFLNASDDHLWAIVTNGLQLRLLRDNPALSRMAFVEFDLEAMMEDPSLFPDFLIFWHLCHHSRLEHSVPEETWLEKWSQGAIQGRCPVLDKLRVGVEQAVAHLGKGFLEHRANEALRDKIRSQELSALEYYRQLLRIIYRLLFLFVSEDRKLLHSPDASEDARKTFDEFYSTRRLRELADSMRGTPHADLWHQLSLLFHAMGDPEGCPQLGLPALGSFLWRAPSSTPDLDGPRPAPKDPSYKFPIRTYCPPFDPSPTCRTIVTKPTARSTFAYSIHRPSVPFTNPYLSSTPISIPTDATSSFVPPPVPTASKPVVTTLPTPVHLRLRPGTCSQARRQIRRGTGKSPAFHESLRPAVGSGHFLISAAHRLATACPVLLRVIRSHLKLPGSPPQSDGQLSLRVDLNPWPLSSASSLFG